MREEWEQLYLDSIEERKLDAIQTSLNGVWRSTVGGCPHLYRGDIDLFQEIIKEWELELEGDNV